MYPKNWKSENEKTLGIYGYLAFNFISILILLKAMYFKSFLDINNINHIKRMELFYSLS